VSVIWSEPRQEGLTVDLADGHSFGMSGAQASYLGDFPVTSITEGQLKIVAIDGDYYEVEWIGVQVPAVGGDEAFQINGTMGATATCFCVVCG